VFPIRVRGRDALAAVLRAHGIQSAIHYTPALHGHPALTGCSIRAGSLPVAEAWAAEELSLPMHSELRTDEIERVAHVIGASAGRPAVRSGRTRY
jgi:dTDP-4-amino-4,6-dideoxygalactose transaminase